MRFVNRHTDVFRQEGGFTLIEILVAITLGTIIMLATYQALDGFTVNAARESKRNDAADQARRIMDRTVRDLRGASEIKRAAPDNLAYSVPTATGSRIERVCVSGGDLYGATVTSGTIDAACTSLSKLASLKLSESTQSSETTAFTYDGQASSATPSKVKNVGFTISLDTTTAGRKGQSTLRASAARRSAGVLPITDADIGGACTAADGSALLTLAASLSGLGPVTIISAASGATALTVVGNTVQVPPGVTSVVIGVTNALGVTSSVTTDVACG